jgi:toxin ParE1/3/4
MGSIIWAREARTDLDELTDYIARDSVHYAQSVANKITQTAKRIPEQPRIGRIVPELNQDDIRERFIYNYRLIYFIKADDIMIIAILHGYRQFAVIEERFADEALQNI